jgi:hypothetical protein
VIQKNGCRLAGLDGDDAHLDPLFAPDDDQDELPPGKSPGDAVVVAKIA